MGFGSGEGFTPGRNNLVGDFTVEGNISASAALSGAYFFGDGSFLQNVTGSGGGGGTVTIGNSIASGTGNRVIYENSANKLAESATLTFNGTTLAAGATTVSTLSASSGITGSSFWIGGTGTGITNTGVISAASSVTSSQGITGSSLQIGPAASGYGITNEGKFSIASFAANWTNAGITVADLGTVTTTDINGGSIDGAIIGANSARAATFAWLTANGNVVLGDADSDTVTIKGVPSIEGVSDTADATLYFKADQGGADAGDEWEFKGADGGVFTIGNDVASAGSYVSQLTLTPNATVANSTTKVEGQLLADSFFINQVAPDDLGNNTNAITIANMLKRIATVTIASSDKNKASDTAANIVGGLTNPVANQSFEFTIINLATGPDNTTLTMTAGTGITLVGAMGMRAEVSAAFRVRLTNVGGGSEAVTIYRIA